MSHIGSTPKSFEINSVRSDSSSRAVNKEDSESFEKSVKNENSDTQESEDTRKNDTPSKKSPGDSILGGLMGQQGQSLNQAEAIAQTKDMTMCNEAMLNKLVDSIMVGTGDNKQEVHIKVSNSVLPDTNIMLRMEDGKLFVQLQTGNADSALTLHQNSDALQERLRVSCKDTEVNVKIIEQTPQKERENQENSQSRGHFLWENEA